MDKKKIVQGLIQTMERTLAAFEWDAQALARSYGPAKWTARQILGHLADCELVFVTRMRFILAEKEPAIVPFEQDDWASRFKYEAQDLALTKETYSVLRRNLIMLLQAAAERDFERRGKHPENPRYTAGYLAEHAASHNAHHLEQLDAIRAGREWKKA